MELNNLKYTKGARGHKVRTYGRGFSSGLGKTSGKGTKGQNSRKSGKVRIGFEGGQTPIYRKFPKVGFNSFNFRTNFHVVSLDKVVAKNLTEVNRETLLAAKIITKQDLPIKLIGTNNPDLKMIKINATVNKASKGAMDLITKAGGEVKIVKFEKQAKPVVTSKKTTIKKVAKSAK